VNPGEAEVVSTGMLWAGTILLSVFVAALLPTLVRLIPQRRFLEVTAHVVVISALFWAGLWLAVVAAFWEPVYGRFFAPWSRWLLPPFFGALYGGAAWCFRSLASRRPNLAVPVFVALGAALGPITHVWELSLGMVEKAPVFRGVSPVMVVVVSAPAFGFYWCLVLLLAVLFQRGHPTDSPAT
jgi:hypothetical protein